MATLVRFPQTTVAERRRNRPDLVLGLSVIGLTVLGLVMIYSATRVGLQGSDLPASSAAERQLIFVTAGLLVAVGASFLDYRELRNYLPIIYAGMLVSLVAVFAFSPVKGAQRWIPLGFFKLQPAEFAKVICIIAMATIMAGVGERGDPRSLSWRKILQVLGVMVIPTALIFREPDLGTMLVLPFIVLVMLFAGGASWRKLLLLVLVGALVTFLAFKLGIFHIRGYQVDRLRVLFNPEVDPKGIGWNLRQSKLAIGSGQLFGRGLFQGTQTNLQYVPEQETDFIFTAVGEQLGFIGGVLVLGAFLVLVWRLLAIAASARDRFGSLLVVGIGALFMFHVFVNVGMTVGIAPVTGLPLPFMSAGGSAYITMAFSIGVANSVWMRRSPVPGEPFIG